MWFARFLKDRNNYLRRIQRFILLSLYSDSVERYQKNQELIKANRNSFKIVPNVKPYSNREFRIESRWSDMQNYKK